LIAPAADRPVPGPLSWYVRRVFAPGINLDTPAEWLVEFRTTLEGRVWMLKKILFVCSGNTCRSPLAEGIAKKLAAQGDLKDTEIFSAGTSTLDGLPASPLAVSVADQHSIDLSSHRSRFLTRTVVGEADLIITMAEKHRETVAIIEPAALEYTYLLTDLCGDEDGDVPDPIGMGEEEYERTHQLIERCLGAFAGSIANFDGWKKK